MNSKRPIFNKFDLKIAALITMLTLGALITKPADAQFIADPAPGRTTPIGQTPAPGAPPPIGQGTTPAPVVQGDAGQPDPPPSGTAQSPPILGTDFPHQNAQTQAITRQYRNDAQQRGSRMVDTRRAPGAAGSSNVQVDDAQLEQQQNEDYPYPTASGTGPTVIHSYRLKDNSVITEPAETKQHLMQTDEISMTSLGKWQEEWTVGRRIHKNTASWHEHELVEPCPTTLNFARWGVLVGLIFATVFMAFSAYAVVLGHKGGGSRVVGTAAGLMLLLMGYTIYKIVVINAFRYPHEENWDQIETLEANNVNNNTPNDTPIVPAAPGGRERTPLPVSPYAGAKNP